MDVIVATDLSEHSLAAVRSASRLAANWESHLQVFFCDEGGAPDATWRSFVETPWETPDQLRKHAREKLDDFLEEAFADTPTPTSISTRVFLDQVEDAVEILTDDKSNQLVVVGATGANGLTRAVFGGTAERIVRVSSAPVLVVPRDRELTDIDRVLAPVDTSDCSRESLKLAVQISREHNSKLHILHALSVPAHTVAPSDIEPPTLDMEAYRAAARDELEQMVDEVDGADLRPTFSFPSDPPYLAIKRTARDTGSDLIVMGTHGRRGFKRLFLGSTASKVLRDIPSPVLVVRARG